MPYCLQCFYFIFNRDFGTCQNNSMFAVKDNFMITSVKKIAFALATLQMFGYLQSFFFFVFWFVPSSAVVSVPVADNFLPPSVFILSSLMSH